MNNPVIIKSLCFLSKKVQWQALLADRSNILCSPVLMNPFHWNKVKEISFDTKPALLSTFLLSLARFSSPCQDMEHSGQKWKS